MDISSLLPLLMAQQGGKGTDISKLLPQILAAQNGGGDMSSILSSLMQNQNQGVSTQSAKPQERFDTNPQYLKSFYQSNPAPSSTQKADEQSNNQTQNAGFNPLALMTMLNGGASDPAALLNMMGANTNPALAQALSLMSANKKNASQTVKTASSISAHLTKPIEIFAPSQIVINIRKLLS